MLEIEEVVDFGSLVASSKTISKEIALTNHGSKAGEFKLKYSGDKPLAIVPTSGNVPPKSVQLIKVNMGIKNKNTCTTNHAIWSIPVKYNYLFQFCWFKYLSRVKKFPDHVLCDFLKITIIT